jgi:hypothetical protein
VVLERRENELTDSRSRSRIKDGGGWTQLGEGKKDAAGDTVNESVPAADWTEDRKRRALSSWSQPDGNWSGTGSQRREKENEMR